MPMRAVRTLDRMMSEMPFEVLIVFLCLFSGLPMALGILPSPGSLIRTLPTWGIRLWGATLSIGGFMAIIGLVMSHVDRRRRFIEGMYIEGGGLLMIGAGALVFGLCILVAAGWPAAFSILIYGVMAASCFFRFRTVRRTVRKMREAIDLERKLQSGD